MQSGESSSRRGMASIGLVTLLGAVPLPAVVQDWYVDVNAPLCLGGIGTQADPFCDIMEAVAAASDGDTIHIAPGMYFENVVLDKNLELIGTGGEQVTILDGAASGSVVRIGSTSIVTLTGLTLTNGSGTVLYGSTTSGGGLFAYDSHAAYDSLPRVTLASCTVTSNSANWGGGVYFVSLGPSSGSDGWLTLEHSTLSNNVGGQGGGGVFSACALTIRDSLIAGNSGAFAGGVISQFGSLTLTNSTVVENIATGPSSYAYAGGISALSGTCVVTNSAVVGNTGRIGGVYAGVSSYCLVTNSTLASNTSSSPYGVGGIAGTGSITEGCFSCPEVTNSIIWGNTDDQVIWVHPEYSLIQGGWSGVGNIDADPLFANLLNGDFRLMPGSPCIDAGNNLSVPLDIWTDLAGKRRFIDDPLTPDTGHPGRLWPIVDMGAHEFGNDPPRKVRRP